MKKLIILTLLFILIKPAFADHAVVIDKITGKILMSNKDPNPEIYKGLMERDIKSSGINLNDVEIKIIPDGEFDQIWYDTITVPIEQEKAQKEAERQQKKNKIKQKLGLSEEEFQDLVDALSR